MPKRHKGKRGKGKFRPARNKLVRTSVMPETSIVSDSGTEDRSERSLGNTKKMPLRRVGISTATLIVTTVAGNILNDISPFWAFVLVVTSLCVFLSYWAWVVSGHVIKWRPFSTTILRILLLLFIVFITLITPQLYISYLIRDRGSIEIPPYTPDSTKINVYYGNRDKPVLYNPTTIGELKEKPIVSFAINGQAVFTIHLLQQREVAIDTILFTGILDENKHIFSRPVTVKDNAPDWKPAGWKIHKSFTSYEIDNENGVPVLIMEYKESEDQYSIIISGLFVTPQGICKVHNEESDAIFQLGDNFNQLGSVYKVDRISIRSISDLFDNERTYDLIEDW